MSLSKPARREVRKSFESMTVPQLEAVVRNMKQRAAKAQCVGSLASREIRRRKPSSEG